MLVLFNGSDWCPACVQLRRAVLATPGLRAWAHEPDCPLRTPRPAAVVAQSEALHRHFAIAGHPSVLRLTARGLNWAGCQRVGPTVCFSPAAEP